MNKAEYLTTLRHELQLETGVVFKTKTIKTGDVISLEISAKGFKQIIGWELYENNEVHDAQKRLHDTAKKVCEALYQNIDAQIRSDLAIIDCICSRYLSENHLMLPTINDSPKCTKDDLQTMSRNVFIDRLSRQVKTLLLLSNQPDQHVLLRHELSIGIILRSCILDCLIVNAWLRDKSRNQRFIRDMVVSSFLVVPTGVKKNIKLEFETVSNYFNVGLKRKINDKKKKKIKLETSNEKILELVKDSPNIKKQYELYSYYSKFDHFSFVPYLMEKTPYEKISLMDKALHLIKFTLHQMLLVSRDPLANEF